MVQPSYYFPNFVAYPSLVVTKVAEVTSVMPYQINLEQNEQN
jgi:hypothetical protein